ncbi:MAG TPA: histidinol-phosphate transaminase [bacterium]|nr:histidinol-phosphate transaminase [bacterium]HOL47303.1 histidinol-phosphate transaminase [bacterium]HPQ17640.1 histidinol-phosphate transaminase [bacterium]
MNNYLNKILKNFPEYIPGEQPQDKKYIKLNTNENPYPPSPKVLGFLQDAITRRLRLYPDPLCNELRKKLSECYNIPKEQIFVGNGSDELLRLAFYTFSNRNEKIVYSFPSYTLFKTLSVLCYCQPIEIELTEEFLLSDKFISSNRNSLKIIANPNSPTGTFNEIDFIEEVVKANKKVVIIDEAYADFAKDNCLRLLKKYKNLIITRTFSKSFSLASIRVGYCFGDKKLIDALYKIKDSYNVNYLSQVAAIAAIEDYQYMKETSQKIIELREYLSNELLKINFKVYKSEANFVFVKPLKIKARSIYQTLKERGILIRYFDAPFLNKYLRISIGTDEEINKLISELKKICE